MIASRLTGVFSSTLMTSYPPRDDDSGIHAPIKPVRSRWPSGIVGRPLTDQRIEYYRQRGWYSAELKEARRQWQEQRRDKARLKREAEYGPNWTFGEDGRPIYSP